MVGIINKMCYFSVCGAERKCVQEVWEKQLVPDDVQRCSRENTLCHSAAHSHHTDHEGVCMEGRCVAQLLSFNHVFILGSSVNPSRFLDSTHIVFQSKPVLQGSSGIRVLATAWLHATLVQIAKQASISLMSRHRELHLGSDYFRYQVGAVIRKSCVIDNR